MERLHRQAAVIPYRIRKERVEVALVTRSAARGWIVPKGSVDQGEQPREAAIREAEEEAGLLRCCRAEAGRPLPSCPATAAAGWTCILMRVTNVRERWLEEVSGGDAGWGSSKPRPACERAAAILRAIEGRPGSDSYRQQWSSAIRRMPWNPCTSSEARHHLKPSRGACRRLLPSRHQPIARHRFTVLDTFDGRVRRAGGRLTARRSQRRLRM